MLQNTRLWIVVIFLIVLSACTTTKTVNVTDQSSVAPVIKDKIDLSVAYYFDNPGFFRQIDTSPSIVGRGIWEDSEIGERRYCRLYYLGGWETWGSGEVEIDMRELGLIALQSVFESAVEIESIDEAENYDLLIIHSGSCNEFTETRQGMATIIRTMREWSLEMKIVEPELSVSLARFGAGVNPEPKEKLDVMNSRVKNAYRDMANEIMDSRATLMSAAGRDMVREHNDELQGCNDREEALIGDYKSIRSNSSLDTCTKLASTEKNFEQMIALYSECPDLDENGAKKQKFETSLSKAQKMISSRCN